jgi:hypothetical protein
LIQKKVSPLQNENNFSKYFLKVKMDISNLNYENTFKYYLCMIKKEICLLVLLNDPFNFINWLHIFEEFFFPQFFNCINNFLKIYFYNYQFFKIYFSPSFFFQIILKTEFHVFRGEDAALMCLMELEFRRYFCFSLSFS